MSTTHASKAPTQAPRGGRALVVVLLLAAVYWGYTPALDGEMQFDDVHAIAQNPAIKDLGHFTSLGLRDLVGSGRALTDFTFALNYRASGLAVRPYHFWNFALHCAAAVALLLLGQELLRRLRWPAPFWTALGAAALFALHPLQTQAVAYICQRAEVFAAMWYALGLLLALRSEQAERRLWRVAAYAGAFACVLLGWASKPTLATFPAALLLCAALFPAREGWKSGRMAAAASLPFWAVTALFSSWLLEGVQGSAHAGFSLPHLSVGRYLLTQSRVTLTYLRLLFWPAGQNLDWDFPPSISAFQPATLLALTAIAAILVAAAWLYRWSRTAKDDEELRALARVASFGILWFFLILAPTSSVVPVADVIEEHRVYLAGWGIFLAVAAAGVLAVRRFIPERARASAAVAGALCVCAALGSALRNRAAVWDSQLSLWSDVAAKSPGKARAHMNLGYALTPLRPSMAIDEYRAALRIGSADGTVNLDELKQDLAGALLSVRRYDEAISILEELSAAAPQSPELRTNLAIADLESGHVDEARSISREVVDRWPRYAPAWHTLGQIAFKGGDFHGAEEHFRRALALDPDSTESLASLAFTEERLGDRAAACTSWAKFARSTAGHAGENAASRLEVLGCAERASR